ncbi:uroporphyrinogen-III C-methyltransferase [bacterium F11]|nr:uroporphyrinogen-III C-methyltransferase [bacterium F11]
MKQKKKGKVYLVGAGPGDPGLITVRGEDLIRSADVIVMDALVNPYLVYSTKARIISVGKRGPGASHGSSIKKTQGGIHRILIQEARKGNRVVRLKGGDPLVFARGGEEMEALSRAHIPFEVVPGVTSLIAVPGYAGIPVSDRRWASYVTFLTGHEGKGRHEIPGVNWSLLPKGGTLVILMGVSRWGFIRQQLLLSGWIQTLPVVAIEWGTTVHQRIIQTTLKESLKEFKKRTLRAPAIIIVGWVGKLTRMLNWIQKEKPLLGKRIVITRSEFQASRITRLLQDKGAEVILCPAIEIQPIWDNPRLNDFYRTFSQEASRFDWVLFLSANAVRIFHAGLKRHGYNQDKFGPKICAVGPQTAQVIENRGWRVTQQAKKFGAEGILEGLTNIRGKRILIPRVEGGPRDIIYGLMKKGARVKELGIYRNQMAPPPPKGVKKLILKGVDAVTFTSASTVRNFLRFFSKSEIRSLQKKTKMVAIGPTTRKVLIENHFQKPLLAPEATIENLVDVLSRKINSK